MDADHGAAICESSEIVIDATAETIWDTLTDFNSWPRWMPGVKSVSLNGPVEIGTRFKWKAGPGTIRSEILESSRARSVGWKGRTLGITAVHVWRIEEQGPGVRTWTEESWDGLLARVLRAPLAKTVKKALDDGLAA